MSDSYVSVTWVANELVTSTKLNQAMTNDSGFHDGTALGDGIIVTRHLGANIVKSVALALSNALDSTNGVKSYTNTGTGSGTGYYINLGGIKLCWGTNSSSVLGTSGGVSISLPASFFTTVQAANLYMASSSTGDGMVRQTTVASTSTLAGWFTSASSCTGQLGWFILGT